MSTSAMTSVAPGVGKLSPEASALWDRFPPRRVPERWPATSEDRQAVLERLLSPPFSLQRPAAQHQRRFGLTRVLEWLEGQPRCSWQERWSASGAAEDGRAGWRRFPDE